eukprot:233007_1
MDENINTATEIAEQKKLILEYQNKIKELQDNLILVSAYNSNSDGDVIIIPKAQTLTIEDEMQTNGSPSEIRSLETVKIDKAESNIFAELQKRRSELPSYAQFCTFEWENINVFVGSGSKQKQILYDMNGSISSGELMAIMGGSGAGKSTLLNILSGRTNLNKQNVSGYFAINHKQFDCSEQSIIKSLCCFVPQSDILCSTQTVNEALLFYAKLKLSNKTLRLQIKRIQYLIKVLHLEKCSDSLIGDMNEGGSKKGISGGERRRVSIAAEIINDVDIIFLDEPTSGLDSYTAAATIKTLKEFCVVSNKMIVATIHQPSIETFYLFDKLILLSRGKCCFNSSIE